MNINTKKIARYGILLLVGMVFVLNGVIGLVLEQTAPPELTDQEIMDRARNLGMVEWREVIRSEKKTDALQTTADETGEQKKEEDEEPEAQKTDE